MTAVALPGHRAAPVRDVRGRVGVVLRALVGLVLLVSVALLTVTVVVPAAAGARPYTVLTGSMSPSYPPGTLVVVRPVPFGEIGVDDVVTYQLRSGEPAVVTHRVVGLATTTDGQRRLVTRGDANPVADAAPVRAEQVRGELWYAVPWVGRLGHALSPDQHRWGVRTAAALLLGYAAVGLWRSRTSRG